MREDGRKQTLEDVILEVKQAIAIFSLAAFIGVYIFIVGFIADLFGYNLIDIPFYIICGIFGVGVFLGLIILPYLVSSLISLLIERNR